MKDCATDVKLASALPEYAKGSHGDLAEQNRLVGAAMAEKGSRANAPKDAGAPEIARANACMSCHGVEKRIVGPGLREVASRYRGQADAEARLLEKLRTGGSGTWGAVPMPANPALAEADARAIIQWILAGAR